MTRETMKEKRARKRSAKGSNGNSNNSMFQGFLEMVEFFVDLFMGLGRVLWVIVSFPFRVIGSIFDGF